MNIYDIAREAGVSITTVSRVLNGKHNVNAETRRKVEHILQKNRYIPSAIARGLVSSSMCIIAVLTIDIRVPDVACAVHAIERECWEHGYHTIVSNTGTDPDEMIKHLECLVRRKVDGIIFVGSIYQHLARNPRVKGIIGEIPVVVTNGRIDLQNVYSVWIDDRLGIQTATEHLLANGHQKIIYWKATDAETERRKVSGYQTAMLGHQLHPLILEHPNSAQGAGDFVQQLCAEQIDCTAIVCSDDIAAVWMIKALQEAGIAVPQEIALTGYGASLCAQMSHPTLTTVDNCVQMMGGMAVQLLTSMIAQQPQSCASITLQPSLVLGKST